MSLPIYNKNDIPRKSGSYIWVSWLAGALSGDVSCRWRNWYRSQYQMKDKVVSDFDLSAWNLAHTTLLNNTCIKFENDGFINEIEYEIKAALPKPYKGIISGKIDLMAIKGNDLVVVDVKTGKNKGSDAMQVIAYMYLLSKSKKYSKYNITGLVQYKNNAVKILRMPPDFAESFNMWVGILANQDEIPERSPGRNECRFCDCIKDVTCDEKIEYSTEEDFGDICL